MEFRLCQACRALRPTGTLCVGCGGPITLADERLFLGEVFGKYQIDAVLGAGGMGVVYRATHATLQRPAALKVVLPRGTQPDFERRFLREARVLAELRHPGIVEIYDFDLAGWGTPYIVMECLLGATLRQVLQANGSRLPVETLAAVLADVAPALRFAHRRGVVHRDLKPDNLFVAGFDGRAVVKLLDFGIAKLLAREGQDERSTDLTASGAVIGTPNYLAPEQILGRDIGPATDQYALALIVAEGLAGRAVRAGKTLGEILGVEIQRPLDPERLPAGLPTALVAALARATQPDPDARFPDVDAFVAALELPPFGDGPRRLAAVLQGLEAAEPSGSPGTIAVGRVATPAATRLDRTGTLARTPPAGSVTRASVPGPPPVPARLPPRRGWLALAVGAAVLATLFWQRPTRPPAASGPAGIAGGALQLRSTFTVAPDATRLLTWLGDTLVLEGGGALYLQPAAGDTAATRIALAEGERVLGAGARGEVFLLQRRKLLSLDVLRQARTLLANTVPDFLPADADNELAQRLRVSPQGRFVVSVQAQGIGVCELRGQSCRPRFDVPRRPGFGVAMGLGDEKLVLALGQQELSAFDLGTGRRLWSRPLNESKVLDVALLEDAGLVAVGGWFDHVDIHALADGAPQGFGRQGRVQRLAWVPDQPTLLLVADAGLSLWRAAEGERGATTDGLVGASVLVSSRGIAVLDARSHQLRLYDYAGLPALARVKLSSQALWCLAADPAGRQVYAGGQDGLVYRYDLARRASESYRLHTDGVTDLAILGAQLASTSDDKTLAVWELPRMNVLWRSQAHTFLINQMHLRAEPPTLWSSSSDGTLKRWGWPQPEAKESIDTRALFRSDLALHAVWASADSNRLLAGTWQHELLALRRRPQGGWSGSALPVASRVVYQRAELQDVRAVAFVGLEPSGAYVYDLEREELLRLPSFGLEPFAVRAGARPGELYVVGSGAALRYQLARTAQGGLRYAATSRVDTRLGPLQALAVLPGTQPRLAAGTDAGELVLLDPSALEGAALASGPLGPVGAR